VITYTADTEAITEPEKLARDRYDAAASECRAATKAGGL